MVATFSSSVITVTYEDRNHNDILDAGEVISVTHIRNGSPSSFNILRDLPDVPGYVAGTLGFWVLYNETGIPFQIERVDKFTYSSSDVGSISDTIPPTVGISGQPSFTDGSTAFEVTVTFSEDVTGFTSGGIRVTNGDAGDPVQGGSAAVYTVSITPDSGGDVVVQVIAGAAEDGARNENTESLAVTVPLDADVPTVGIMGALGGPLPSSTDASTAFEVTVTFSEDVTGFTVEDIRVANGTAGSFFGSDGDTEYRATITPDGGGDITINIDAGAAQDFAGNGNEAAEEVIVVYQMSQKMRDETVSQVKSFMETGARLLHGHRSDRSRRLARLKYNGTGGGEVSYKGHTLPVMPVSLSGSPVSLLSSMNVALGEDKTKLVYSCTKNRNAVCMKTDIWLEGTLGTYKNDNAKGKYGILHAGVDRRLYDRLLVGVTAQFDHVVQNAGTASNRITMPGASASDKFSSWRWSAYGALFGSFIHSNFTFNLNLGLGWFDQDSES